MSSQFAARNKGVCALSGASFEKGEMVMFLVRHGTDEKPLGGPENQIVTSKKEDDYETGYRSVPAGTITTGNGRFRRTKTVFAVEQQVAGGRWIRVAVWSNIVIVSKAREAGYNVSGRTVIAHKGKRLVGHEHTLDRASVASVPYADLTAARNPGLTAAIEAHIETGEKVRSVDLTETVATPVTFEAVAHVSDRARNLDLD